MFNHCEIDVTPLKRVNLNGTRYYKVGDQKLPSITSILFLFSISYCQIINDS